MACASTSSSWLRSIRQTHPRLEAMAPVESPSPAPGVQPGHEDAFGSVEVVLPPGKHHSRSCGRSGAQHRLLDGKPAQGVAETGPLECKEIVPPHAHLRTAGASVLPGDDR